MKKKNILISLTIFILLSFLIFFLFFLKKPLYIEKFDNNPDLHEISKNYNLISNKDLDRVYLLKKDPFGTHNKIYEVTNGKIKDLHYIDGMKLVDMNIVDNFLYFIRVKDSTEDLYQFDKFDLKNKKNIDSVMNLPMKNLSYIFERNDIFMNIFQNFIVLDDNFKLKINGLENQLSHFEKNLKTLLDDEENQEAENIFDKSLFHLDKIDNGIYCYKIDNSIPSSEDYDLLQFFKCDDSNNILEEIKLSDIDLYKKFPNSNNSYTYFYTKILDYSPDYWSISVERFKKDNTDFQQFIINNNKILQSTLDGIIRLENINPEPYFIIDELSFKNKIYRLMFKENKVVLSLN